LTLFLFIQKYINNENHFNLLKYNLDQSCFCFRDGEIERYIQ
jgi:hypothetical protein